MVILTSVSQSHLCKTILLGQFSTAPYFTAENDHTTACVQAAGAAETAIDLCVLSRRADVLWGEVYPRYLACGQHPTLLERLLPHILASKLPSLPPEVMQVGCTGCMLLAFLTMLKRWKEVGLQ